MNFRPTLRKLLAAGLLSTIFVVSTSTASGPSNQKSDQGSNQGTEEPAALWKPTPGTSWQIQFSGTLNANVNVKAFDLDLYDTPDSFISKLRSRGIKIICYFSAGTSEDWRPDYGKFSSAVKGKPLGDWPGENWLDVRNLKELLPIMQARMDLAKQRGCDALDLDNMDVYTQNSGFQISYEQQLIYNKTMAEEAHLRNLSIGLKNDVEQIPDLVNSFDFAINESCWDYNECNSLLPFIQQGKAVFGIEYEQAATRFCPKANALNFDFLKKRMNLNAYRVSCR
jgi:hypothetical protein